jgi:cell shape-determining protein MreC
LKKKNYGASDMKVNNQRLFRPLKLGLNNSVFIFIISSFLLFVYAVKHENITFFIFDKINALLLCVETPVTFIKNQIARVAGFVKDKEELLDEIEKLKQTIITYKKHGLVYKNISRENEYLTSILPLIKALNVKTITVVQKPAPAQPFVSISSLSEEFVDTVAVGNAVLSEHGLFGRVIAKNGDKVMILLATHLQSRIPIVSTQSKKRAVLFGKNNNYLKIKYVDGGGEELSKSSKLQATKGRGENDGPPFFEDEKQKDGFINGEILETSDEGGFFPKSIPVARIEKDNNGNIRAKWLCSDEPSAFITIAIYR